MIRTVPSQMYYTPQWFKRMERWLGDSSLQPLVNIAKQHETTYGAMQRFIEKPPGKLRIFEIYPPKPLLSMALGSRLPALRMDYKTGRLCGRYFLATVGKMLAEQPPLHRHKASFCRLPLWPMTRWRCRWWTRRRPTMAYSITRIWHDALLYRYPLPL